MTLSRLQPFTESAFYNVLAEMPSLDDMTVAIQGAIRDHPKHVDFIKAVGFFVAMGRLPSWGIQPWDIPALKDFASRLVSEECSKQLF